MEIKIKYFCQNDDDFKEDYKLNRNEKQDWFDLRSAINIELKAGEYKLIPLGVAMDIPDGWEAHIAPRSSTFKTWGIIQANSIGVVDNSFKGPNDQWHLPVYATRDTLISKYDRICQFRIEQKMPIVSFKESSLEGNEDRNGFGSSGIK